LRDADDGDAVAEDAIDDREKVRIEGRLIEDVAPDPVTIGNAPRPEVIGLRVAEAEIEEWRVSDLREVKAAQAEGEKPDGEEKTVRCQELEARSQGVPTCL
jgi:hypothetical protein